MGKVINFLVSGAALLLFSGCAVSSVDFEDTPSLPENYGVKVASVLFSIECEIVDALERIRSRESDPATRKNLNPDFLESLAARVTTTLQIVNNANSNLTLSPTVALASAGTLTGGVTGRSNLLRTRESVIVNDIYFVEAILNNKKDCDDATVATDSDNVENELVRIKGALGFETWLEELVIGFSQFGLNLERLNYNMTFLLVNDAELGVVFTPTSSFADRLGVGANLQRLNSTTHKIEMQTIENDRLKQSLVLIDQRKVVSQRERKRYQEQAGSS